jgi:hypothetical protein
MPRKPEPLVIEHVYNPDPDEGREAFITTLQHLIEFILENDEAEIVDKPEVA